MKSKRSEMIVLSGRRRVGKTFLIRSFFQDKYTFHFVGRYKKSKKVQLEAFRSELIHYGAPAETPELKSWKEAFDQLSRLLEKSNDERKVVFLDEIPWMDRHGNELIGELEDFWNCWVTNRDDIVLVACGSATAWMRKKIMENKGGLHRRITQRIYVRPFCLNEVREYLRSHMIDWSDYQIMQCYMAIGGIPYYLSLLKPYLSLAGNIDELFFQRGSMLEDEIDELFPALFNNADKYMQLVRFLSTKRVGFTRQEIEAKTGWSGGGLTTILENLEDNDFISKYAQIGYRERNVVYRLTDFFLIFYFHFIDGNLTRDEQFWQHHQHDRGVESWEGFTFEQLCLWHLDYIKKGLGISGMATEASVWRYTPTAAEKKAGAKGAQIDLVIKRADKLTHLCEMKFSDHKYVVSQSYAERLRERKAIFAEKTGIAHGLIDTFITPEGVSPTAASSFITCSLTVEDLFANL